MLIKDFSNKPWQAYQDDNHFILDYNIYEKKQKYCYVTKQDEKTKADIRLRVSQKDFDDALLKVKRLIEILPQVGFQLVS